MTDGRGLLRVSVHSCFGERHWDAHCGSVGDAVGGGLLLREHILEERSSDTDTYSGSAGVGDLVPSPP